MSARWGGALPKCCVILVGREDKGTILMSGHPCNEARYGSQFD